MNIRELEALLIQVRENISANPTIFSDNIHMEIRLSQAINWAKSQQKTALKRRAHFKHRADEQRELLR